MDALAVGLEITQGIGFAQRRLAKHVEGVPVGLVFAAYRSLQRRAYIAPHDKLMAHDAHSLAHGGSDHRLAQAAGDACKVSRRIFQRFPVRFDDMAGQHQAPGRCVDEYGVAGTQVIFPVARGNLVGDQAIRGIRIGNSQQRLGQAHQYHAFL